MKVIDRIIQLSLPSLMSDLSVLRSDIKLFALNCFSELPVGCVTHVHFIRFHFQLQKVVI